MPRRLASPVPKFCVAALVAIGALSASTAYAQASGSARFITQTDRLIVKYKDAVQDSSGAIVPRGLDSTRQAHIDRAGQQAGATLRALRATANGANVFQINRNMTLAEAGQLAADLKARDANIEYAEPDRIMVPLATPTDPYYANYQWDLFETTGGINAPAAWDKSTGSGINVAVIDTGYRSHQDLSGAILQGYDFITSTTMANDGGGRDTDASDPGDWTSAGSCSAGVPASDENSSWHGTHVAGTIAARANNGLGIAGIAYNAKIVPARVLGRCGGYTSDIADAITWASGGTVNGVPANANKARVLNLSLGGTGSCDTTTQNAISGARSRGAVVVVSAGNANGDAAKDSPANCSGVIAVAATNRAGGKASYSNTGSNIAIAAPGGESGAAILSTYNAGTTAPGNDNYAFAAGTSMAAPHVAAVAALMLSANPNLTPDEVAAKLKSSARAFPAACSGCGAGIVDAAAAVNAALSAATTTTTATAASMQAEAEPNNTLSTANAVAASGTTFTGTISSANDTDYVVVQLPGGKTLSAVLTPAASSDLDLYAYNSAGAQLGGSTNGTGLADSLSIANSGATSQPVSLRVRYKSGSTGNTAAYQLKLSW